MYIHKWMYFLSSHVLFYSILTINHTLNDLNLTSSPSSGPWQSQSYCDITSYGWQTSWWYHGEKCGQNSCLQFPSGTTFVLNGCTEQKQWLTYFFRCYRCTKVLILFKEWYIVIRFKAPKTSKRIILVLNYWGHSKNTWFVVILSWNAGVYFHCIYSGWIT